MLYLNMSSQVASSRARQAVMEDWNWALGYGIAKDKQTGNDVFVHHSFVDDSVMKRGECTGFSWLNEKGEKVSGNIGRDKRWLERRDVIYYVADPDFPNVALHVSLTYADTMEASLPGDGTLGN